MSTDQINIVKTSASGKSFEYATLNRMRGGCPLIRVDVSKLNPDWELAVDQPGASTETLTKQIVSVCPVDDTWIVLTGHETVKEKIKAGATQFEAFLVSKQLLKKLEVLRTPVEVQNRKVEAQIAAQELAERSRMMSQDYSDDRRPRYRNDGRPNDRWK